MKPKEMWRVTRRQVIPKEAFLEGVTRLIHEEKDMISKR